MTWTTWIETEPEETNDERTRLLYQRTREHTTGSASDIVRLNSLTPQVAGLLHDLQKAIYHGTKGLTIREKEIAALIVSTYNGCVH